MQNQYRADYRDSHNGRKWGIAPVGIFEVNARKARYYPEIGIVGVGDGHGAAADGKGK